MKCEEARDELIAYARGELDAERKAAVEEHLVRCAGCTKELEDVRQVMALTQMADEASVAAMANDLFAAAIKAGASDIHIERPGPSPVIRIRIDGALRPGPEISLQQYMALVARVKLLAGMSLSERRQPHEGRILFTHEGKDFDLRAAVFPYIHGEAITLRILDRSVWLPKLENMGFAPEVMAGVEGLLAAPQGIIAVTGPNGCGKTTTLYTMLMRLNRPENKIMTIEDPVEGGLPGVNQAAVNAKEGLTFAAALRSFARQDPDIVMLGEVRDFEALEACIQLAITGHLMLTTLHTSDAPSALARMVEVGVEPLRVAASVIGVLGQRLVRKVCPECKESYALAPEAAARLGIAPEPGAPVTLTRGKGCEKCRQTGYRGRTGIFELLVMNDDLKEVVIRRGPVGEIREAARAAGMRSLREDGLQKALQGITTVDEVLRVTGPAGDVI